MPTAIVTGANSGIGHSLAKIFVREGYSVMALDRDDSGPITSLGCEAYRLDVSSLDDINSFLSSLGDRTVDVLLNVAGVIPPWGEDDLATVNTFGPFLLTQALLPNIRKSDSPRIGVMSSRVGSIGDNSSGRMYAYRSSKAAVNALFKSLAVNIKSEGIPIIVMHPGSVVTNGLRAWRDGADGVKGAVGPDEAAEDLWRTFKGVGMESTGNFLHRSGEELPW